MGLAWPELDAWRCHKIRLSVAKIGEIFTIRAKVRLEFLLRYLKSFAREFQVSC